MTFSTVLYKLKEIMNRMFGVKQTLEQTLNISPSISDEMTEAIDRWTAMYEDKAEWLHEPSAADPTKVVSLGLPAFIASEKARMAVIELQSEITAPKETIEKDNPDYHPPVADAFGNVQLSGQPQKIVEEVAKSPEERAKFMNKEYHEKLLSNIRTQLEYGIAKGGLIIKPYVIKSKQQPVAGSEVESTEDKYNFAYDFIQADCFYPFAFNGNNDLTEVAFLQTKTDKDKIYTRLEYHKLVGNTVEITNKAYENNVNTTVNQSAIVLGKEIPLSSVYEWKNIPPRATIKNVDRLLFGYFKMPDANTIDPHSPLGISGFARAEKLIKEADLQYSRLLWEYEGGELAIDIDRDALADVKDFKGNSHTVMGHLQQRLYRPIDLGESNTYQPFTPALRDNSMINGLNTLLMRIEDVVAMSRGTVSEVAAEARTATEIRVLKQRSYSSNLEIQKALEKALRDTIYAMDVYCTVYNIVDDVVKDSNGNIDQKKIGQYDVSFTWDDSILVDVETELNKRMTLLNAGLVSKQEVREWYFGETPRQAKDALTKIKEENQEAIEQNMAVSAQMGASIQQSKGSETPQKQPQQPQQAQTTQGEQQQAQTK